MTATYYNFDLRFEEEGAELFVHGSTDGEESTLPFRLPLSGTEVENLLLRMGAAPTGLRRTGDTPALHAAREFGTALFDAAITGEIRDIFRRAQERAEDEGARLRVRLIFNNAPRLANLPWEFLYDRGSNVFLALSLESPIVRYIENNRRVAPLLVTPPLRMLVVVSAPADLAPLDADAEWRHLRASLDELVKSGRIEIERADPPTLGHLQNRLREKPYQLLHFVGHGAFDAGIQDGLLFLEDERRHSAAVTGQSLGILLRDYRSTLHFVLLNICEGGRSAAADPFAGVAQSLTQQGIAAVLAMQSHIQDASAIRVAYEFYAALADGYPLEAAITEARKALFASQQNADWGVPALFTRAPDGHLFRFTQGPTPVAAASAMEQEVLRKPAPRETPVVPAGETGKKRLNVPLLLLAGLLLVAAAVVLAQWLPRSPAAALSDEAPTGGQSQVPAADGASDPATLPLFPSATPDTAAAPYVALRAWLNDAARRGDDADTVRQALLDIGSLSAATDLDTSADLDGDGAMEWVVQTPRDSQSCNNLYVVVAGAGVVYDTLEAASALHYSEVVRREDLSADATSDLLLSVASCGSDSSHLVLLTVHAPDGGLVMLQEQYGLLQLLDANRRFDEGNYAEAAPLYREVMTGNWAATGWLADSDAESVAVRRFALARLVISEQLENLNSRGRAESEFLTHELTNAYNLYGALFNAQVILNQGRSHSEACIAFRGQLDTETTPWPLDALGLPELTLAAVCPF